MNRSAQNGSALLRTAAFFLLCFSCSISSICQAPVSAAPYLTKLTLNPPGIKENQSSTGTVTLSAPAPAGGFTVTLATDKTSAITLPATVVVAAGSLSADFTLVGKPKGAKSEEIFVEVTGKSGEWMQGAILTLIPSGTPLRINELVIRSGEGVALLSWEELPSNSVKGYRVFRRLRGSADAPTELTVAALFSCYFVDNTAGKGNYVYQVAVQNWDDSLRRSSWMAPTASAVRTSALVFLPSAASGIIFFSAQYPLNEETGETILLIDGEESGNSTVNSFDLTKENFHLDTSGLVNGAHKIQVISVGSTVNYAGNVATLTTSNPIRGLYLSPFFFPAEGQAELISASVSSKSNLWTLTVVNKRTSAIVLTRTAQGGFEFHFAWDGRDSSQAIVTDVCSITVTARDKRNSEQRKTARSDPKYSGPSRTP